MQLFYHPDIKIEQKTFSFTKEESRHILKVLRKQVGDMLTITDGKGTFYTAEIESLDQKSCICSISGSQRQEPLPYYLHMVVAPTKLNDRFEWFLEKATEIGVSEITPIVCHHSERKVIKKERMERILQAAMKQSLKAYLPKLNSLMSFDEFIESENIYDVRGIAHCRDGEKGGIKNNVKPGDSTCILIGPEGDFSKEEVDKAIVKGFLPLHLGNSRLRTETAAIVAVQSVAFINDN